MTLLFRGTHDIRAFGLLVWIWNLGLGDSGTVADDRATADADAAALVSVEQRAPAGPRAAERQAASGLLRRIISAAARRDLLHPAGRQQAPEQTAPPVEIGNCAGRDLKASSPEQRALTRRLEPASAVRSSTQLSRSQAREAKAAPRNAHPRGAAVSQPCAFRSQLHGYDAWTRTLPLSEIGN
jgi:hypothetical protein